MAPIPTSCPTPLPSIVPTADHDSNGWSKQTILALVGVHIVPATPCAALLLRMLHSKFKTWKSRREANANDANVLDITNDHVEAQATSTQDHDKEPSVEATVVKCVSLVKCDSVVDIEEHLENC